MVVTRNKHQALGDLFIAGDINAVERFLDTEAYTSHELDIFFGTKKMIIFFFEKSKTKENESRGKGANVLHIHMDEGSENYLLRVI